jgi:hypothetical protein
MQVVADCEADHGPGYTASERGDGPDEPQGNLQVSSGIDKGDPCSSWIDRYELHAGRVPRSKP